MSKIIAGLQITDSQYKELVEELKLENFLIIV